MSLLVASPLRVALSKRCCTKYAHSICESRALYGVTQRSAFQIWKLLLLQICISMALTSTRELHAPSPPSAAHALLMSVNSIQYRGNLVWTSMMVSSSPFPVKGTHESLLHWRCSIPGVSTLNFNLVIWWTMKNHRFCTCVQRRIVSCNSQTKSHPFIHNRPLCS